MIKGSDGFSEDKKLVLYPQKIKKTSVRWKPAKAGKHTITAEVGCKADTNQENNKRTLNIEVKTKP